MIRTKIAGVLLLAALAQNTIAGPPGFGGNDTPDPMPQSGGGGGTSVPIDDGIGFFLLAAAGAGSWLLGKKKKSV